MLGIVCFATDIGVKHLTEGLGTLKGISIDNHCEYGCNANAHSPNDYGYDCPHCEFCFIHSCHDFNVSVIWDNHNPLVYRFRTSCAPISSSLSGLPLPSTAEFTTFLFEAIRE